MAGRPDRPARSQAAEEKLHYAGELGAGGGGGGSEGGAGEVSGRVGSRLGS